MRSSSTNPKVPQILDAASKCFCERGVDETTMSDVAREAGVSRSTLAREYTSKDELLREAVRERVLEFARASVCRCPEVRAATKVRCIAHCFAVAARDQDLPATHRLLASTALRFPDLPRLYDVEVTERVSRDLRRVIELGVQNGEFHVPDPRGVAAAMAQLLAHALPFAIQDLVAAANQMADTMLRQLLMTNNRD